MGSQLNPARREETELVRATISRLDGGGGRIETLEVAWNPASFRLRRGTAEPLSLSPHLSADVPTGVSPRLSGVAPLGANIGETLSMELPIDTASRPGGDGDRDARRVPATLRSWMDPLPESLAPPRVLFLWGPQRFAGFIEDVEEEWTRFDPDGTPTRGRVRLTMRGLS